MVLLERIELSTSPLPRECSTSELQQPGHMACGRLITRKFNMTQAQSGPSLPPALQRVHEQQIRTTKNTGWQNPGNPRGTIEGGVKGQYGAP